VAQRRLRSVLVAVASFTIARWTLERVPIVSIGARLAFVVSSVLGVVHALQTGARQTIAVAVRVRVGVAAAVALPASCFLAELGEWITEVSILTDLASITDVPFRAVHALHRQADQEAVVAEHARAGLAVIGVSSSRVSIEAGFADLAVLAGSVVAASALTSLRVAQRAVVVTLTRHASAGLFRTSARSSESWRAALTLSSGVSSLAQTLLLPRHLFRRVDGDELGGLHVDDVDGATPVRQERHSDLYGRQISQDRLEVERGHAGGFDQFVVVHDEAIFRYRVALVGDAVRCLASSTFENDILGTRLHLWILFLAEDSVLEGQPLRVTAQPVAEVSLRSDEVEPLTTVRLDHHVLLARIDLAQGCVVVPELVLNRPPIQIDL